MGHIFASALACRCTSFYHTTRRRMTGRVIPMTPPYLVENRAPPWLRTLRRSRAINKRRRHSRVVVLAPRLLRASKGFRATTSTEAPAMMLTETAACHPVFFWSLSRALLGRELMSVGHAGRIRCCRCNGFPEITHSGHLGQPTLSGVSPRVRQWSALHCVVVVQWSRLWSKMGVENLWPESVLDNRLVRRTSRCLYCTVLVLRKVPR